MKSIQSILLTLLAIYSAYVSFAQQPEWNNPLPLGNTVNDIEFFDNQNGLMAASQGSIALTSDGGQNWSAIQNLGVNTLLKIEITGVSSAVIMSEKDLHKTVNYGQTWQSLYQLTGKTFIGIDMLDDQKGYCLVKRLAGNFTYELGKTVDGGANWSYTVLDSLQALDAYYDLAFEDENTGILIRRDDGMGVIMKTTNGGASFIKNTFNGTVNFKSTTYAGSGVYYIAGVYYTLSDVISVARGLIYKSTDHGETWFNTFPDINQNLASNFSGIKAFNQQTIYAYGRSEYEESYHIPPIFVSFDGGNNWEKADIPNVYEWKYKPAITALGIRSNLSAFAYSDGVELPLKTVNALNFDFFGGAFGGHIKDVSFKGNTVNYCTDYFVLHSTSGGNSFDSVSIEPYTSNVDLYLTKISFADETEGLAAGNSYGLNGTADIFSTRDGGVSWTRIIDNSLAKPIDLNFMAWNRAYLFGKNYTFQPFQVHKKLFVSENLGNTWSELNLPSDSLNSMQFINPLIGYLFGGKGSTTEGGYYKTTNGGNSWVYHSMGLDEPATGRMLNENSGFVLEKNRQSVYFFSDDNGLITTREVFTDENGLVLDFGFSSENNGYVLVKDSANNDLSWIFQTSNGGNNWTKYGPYPFIKSLKVFYDQNGYAFGDYGRVLQLGNGYPVGLPVIHATMTKLEASPNPANETITIEWMLPEGSREGQLKIFNMAGQEKYRFNLTGKTGNKSIDLRKYDAGLYLITLSTTNQTLVSKKISVCK